MQYLQAAIVVLTPATVAAAATVFIEDARPHTLTARHVRQGDFAHLCTVSLSRLIEQF